MAKFTVSVPVKFEWRGLTIDGAAGATHRIPDPLYDEFIDDFVTNKTGAMPGLAWISQDEQTAVGGAHPDLATHTTLGLISSSHLTADDPHVLYALDADLYNHEAAGHVHAHAYSALTSIPATFAPATHAHVDADLPASIARDSEVSASIVSHEATATHGGGATMPPGVIVMWGGAVTAIPSGWLLCNGLSGTPDLRSRFIKGAAIGADPGATGGATTHGHAGHTDHAALTHLGSAVAAHTVTQPTAAGEAAHAHAYTQTVNHVHVENGPSAATGGLVGWTPDASTNTSTASGYSTANPTGGVASGTTAAGASHTHSMTGSAVSAHAVTQPDAHAAQSHSAHDTPNSEPPYYALCFIQKS